MKYILAFLVLFVSFVGSSAAYAQVEITEIMYDLEGGDAGLEWVEVHNTGSSGVDLSQWRFLEADVNHKLGIIYGDGVLGVGEYGIIVSDVSPIKTGEVFDSSFSLSNTGELIGLRDSNLADVFMVTYSGEWGASGDGNSLQNIDGVWKASTPTPGERNSATVINPDPVTPSPDDDTPTQEGVAEETVRQLNPQARLEPRMNVSVAPRDVAGIAGTRVVLEGRATNEYGYDMLSARYFWNFGDGTQGEGKRTEHIYQYPGVYMTTLTVSAGGFAGEDRAKVSIVPADISISNVGTEGDMFIELHNKTLYELELSGWRLRAGDSEFVFPKGTYMFPGKTIVLAQRVTGLSSATQVVLTYPDGTSVDTYEIEEPAPKEEVSAQQQAFIQQDQYTGNLSRDSVVVKSEAVGTAPTASLIQEDSALVELVVSRQSQPEEPAESEENRGEEEILQGNLSQLAATQKISNNDNTGLFWGLMGVVLLILIAIYAILDRKPESNEMGIKSEADLYKVIEIDD